MKIADEYLDPGCLTRGPVDEDGLCSGPCPSCDRERHLRELRKRSIQSLLGKYGRQILRQYNEAGFNHCASLTFHGPHYVTYDRGEFRLRPYGSWARYRHSFECRPETVPWQEDLLWTFMVLP